MRIEVEDLRRVVRRARASAAARSCSAATRSAARSRRPTRRGTSRGRPGARGLSGLVFIDGGSRRDADLARASADARLRELAPGRRGSRSAGSPRRSPGCSTPAGRRSCRIAPDAPSIAQSFRLLPANLKRARAGDERRRVRLRARHGHLARPAGRGAGAPGPARTERRAEGMGRRRGADAAAPVRRHVLRLGPEGPRRHGLVPPAAADDRRGGGGRGQRQPGTAHARLRAVHGDDLPKRLRIYAFAASLGGRASSRPPGPWPPSPASRGAALKLLTAAPPTPTTTRTRPPRVATRS